MVADKEQVVVGAQSLWRCHGDTPGQYGLTRVVDAQDTQQVGIAGTQATRTAIGASGAQGIISPGIMGHYGIAGHGMVEAGEAQRCSRILADVIEVNPAGSADEKQAVLEGENGLHKLAYVGFLDKGRLQGIIELIDRQAHIVHDVEVFVCDGKSGHGAAHARGATGAGGVDGCLLAGAQAEQDGCAVDEP